MPDKLSQEIISALYAVKAQNLPHVCVDLGLAAGTTEDAFASKRSYVSKRIEGLSQPALIALAEKVLAAHRTYALEEALEAVKPSVAYRIDEITRRAVIRELDALGSLNGHLDLFDFLERIWPLKELPWSGAEPRKGAATVRDGIERHMLRNDDWSVADLFETLRAREVSNRRFGTCLEMVVSPLVRDEADQRRYAQRINVHLAKTGYALRPVEHQSGYPVYRIVASVGGVAGTAKT